MPLNATASFAAAGSCSAPSPVAIPCARAAWTPFPTCRRAGNRNPPGRRLMDNQRIFLYGALFFVLFLIWDAWQKDHAPAPQEVATETRAPSFDAGLPEL